MLPLPMLLCDCQGAPIAAVAIADRELPADEMQHERETYEEGPMSDMDKEKQIDSGLCLDKHAKTCPLHVPKQA